MVCGSCNILWFKRWYQHSFIPYRRKVNRNLYTIDLPLGVHSAQKKEKTNVCGGFLVTFNVFIKEASERANNSHRFTHFVSCPWVILAASFYRPWKHLFWFPISTQSMWFRMLIIWIGATSNRNYNQNKTFEATTFVYFHYFQLLFGCSVVETFIPLRAPCRNRWVGK